MTREPEERLVPSVHTPGLNDTGEVKLWLQSPRKPKPASVSTLVLWLSLSLTPQAIYQLCVALQTSRWPSVWNVSWRPCWDRRT